MLMPKEGDDLRTPFVAAAREAVVAAAFDDLLGFLTIRRLAPGSAHARFKQAFGAGAAGRQALVRELQHQATLPSEIAPHVEIDLMRLANDLRERVPDVANRIKQIALSEFDAYATDSDQRSNEVVRSLMIAVATTDERSRDLLAKRYESTDRAYAEQYRALLSALGREVIPEVGSAHDLALIMASMLDGFLTRSAIEAGENRRRVRELFAAILVPVLAALTHPHGSLSLPDENRLYGDLTRSATAAYRRTPPWAQPLDDLEQLVGTWRGTMYTNVVTRDPELGRGPRETYLVIDNARVELQIRNFIATGISRMIFPRVTKVAGRYRLACMYEADLSGNPTPDWPSHRGAWILESDEAVDRLDAVYFNDRSARGSFVFDNRVESVADTYFEAQTLCASELGPWEPAAEKPGLTTHTALASAGRRDDRNRVGP
jgi:hypothetical protein